MCLAIPYSTVKGERFLDLNNVTLQKNILYQHAHYEAQYPWERPDVKAAN